MSGRDAFLQRLARQRGPTDPELRAAWERLPAGQRHRLRRAATDPTAAAHLDDSLARDLVDALAAERSRRRGWDVALPFVTGLLVLSTVWGFGRAALPDVAGWFLLAGLLGAATTTVVGWRRRAVTRSRARAVRSALRR